MKQRLILAALAYVGTVVGANWAIGHLGIAPQFPGAPHTLPVGFGLTAPSGVLFVALALILRDYVQWALGRKAGEAPTAKQIGAMLALIAVASGLSFLVAVPALAWASAAAFLFSELADFILFTIIAPRWASAVLVGGLAGAVIDSWVFLSIAFGSVAFMQGQVLGKAYGILLAFIAIPLLRRKRVAVAA